MAKSNALLAFTMRWFKHVFRCALFLGVALGIVAAARQDIGDNVTGGQRFLFGFVFGAILGGIAGSVFAMTTGLKSHGCLTVLAGAVLGAIHGVILAIVLHDFMHVTDEVFIFGPVVGAIAGFLAPLIAAGSAPREDSEKDVAKAGEDIDESIRRQVDEKQLQALRRGALAMRALGTLLACCAGLFGVLACAFVVAALCGPDGLDAVVGILFANMVILAALLAAVAWYLLRKARRLTPPTTDRRN